MSLETQLLERLMEQAQQPKKSILHYRYIPQQQQKIWTVYVFFVRVCVEGQVFESSRDDDRVVLRTQDEPLSFPKIISNSVSMMKM